MPVDRVKMGKKHEEHWARVSGAVRTRGSGNQWQNPTDGRENRLIVEWAAAADCKSTLAESVAIQKKDLRKLREQAGGEMPVLPVCFWASERLDEAEAEFYVLQPEAEWLSMREAARASLAIADVQDPGFSPPAPAMTLTREEHESLASTAALIAIPPGKVLIGRDELLMMREELARLRPPSLPPGYTEVVIVDPPGGIREITALRDGKPYPVASVRIEQGTQPGAEPGEPEAGLAYRALIVNEVRVRSGILIRNGVTEILVGEQPGG